jgi:hypothetical protein
MGAGAMVHPSFHMGGLGTSSMNLLAATATAQAHAPAPLDTTGASSDAGCDGDSGRAGDERVVVITPYTRAPYSAPPGAQTMTSAGSVRATAATGAAAALAGAAGATPASGSPASAAPPSPAAAEPLPLTSPVPGVPPPPAQLLHERPFYSIIVDGVHCHPYAVSMAHETHPSGLICVTDAMRAMGLPVGRHRLGEMDVELYQGSEDGHYEGLHAVIAGTATLAGAVVPLDKCVRNLRAYTECSLERAVDSVTRHPARLLRLEDTMGTLRRGTWADMVVLDDQCHVLQTYLAGQLVWARGVGGLGQAAAVAAGSGPAGSGGGVANIASAPAAIAAKQAP